MTSPSYADLLVDAPPGRHFAQLHKDSRALADAVHLFVEMGLRRGDAVIVVAPANRTALYLERLDKQDQESWQRLGQLQLMDSQAMLNRFMQGDLPEWNEFRTTVSAVIEKAKLHGGENIRVYGEMVNDLWRAGNPAAAIKLEEYWNKLARLYRFCLFCGYQMDSMEEQTYAAPLAEIGRTHSDILLSVEDEQFYGALDSASHEVLGIPLSRVMSCNECDESTGEHRLSKGHQIMLWMQKNMPAEIPKILKRARQIYAEERGATPLVTQNSNAARA